MKHKIILLIAAFHLLFIIVNSFGQTITAYLDFYVVSDDDKKEVVNSLLANTETGIKKVVGVKPLQVYSKYSGTEMGYGFFAPNVLSSGGMSFTYKNKTLVPSFKSHESYVRFTALISQFVGHLVNNKRDNNSPQEKYLTDMQDSYFNLVFKNIATKIYTDHSCSDYIIASVNLYDFPDLEAYNANAKEKNVPTYIALKSEKIIQKP